MSERATKRARTRRASEHTTAVTDRDLDLLTLVGLCGYLSSEQLARELFPTTDRCRRRLRQLYDAGLLAVTLQSSTAPNLVSLTSRGLAAMAERLPELAARLRLLGHIRLAGTTHHLAIVDVRLYAAALGRRRGTPLTRWANAGGDLIRELGFDRVRLAPDGVAEFAVADGRSYVAVEVDCSTEPLAVLSGKLARYQTAAIVCDELLEAVWVVVRAGVERERSLAALVATAGMDKWALVVPHQGITARPVVEITAGGGQAESARDGDGR